MPNRIKHDLHIKDAKVRRCRFGSIRIGQVFYANGRWWQKKTRRTAVRADDSSRDSIYYRQATMIRVLEEGTKERKPPDGVSFDEFMNESVLPLI